MKNLEEALRSPDLIQELIAAGPAVRHLALWAVAEVDRRQLARRNSTLAAMQNAVDDRLMADIVNDSRRGVSSPSSLATTPDAPKPPEPVRGTGWQDDRGFSD